MSSPAANNHDVVVLLEINEAIKQVFKVQASTDVTLGKIEAIARSQTVASDVTAVISLSSPALKGTLALCFPNATFLGIVGRMFGETFTEVTTELSDGAGEFLNMIYGVARTKINQQGHGFAPAIPSVVRGSQIYLTHGEGSHILMIPCRCDAGAFHMEMSLKRVGEGGAAQAA
jgi:chemotaxis protein CheX